MARGAEEAILHEGIIPPEFSANLIKHVREGDVVKLWFYSRLVDPLASGRPTDVRACIVTVPAKVFDSFIAERGVKVLERIADGHAQPEAA